LNFVILGMTCLSWISSLSRNSNSFRANYLSKVSTAEVKRASVIRNVDLMMMILSRIEHRRCSLYSASTSTELLGLWPWCFTQCQTSVSLGGIHSCLCSGRLSSMKVCSLPVLHMFGSWFTSWLLCNIKWGMNLKLGRIAWNININITVVNAASHNLGRIIA
jgi:hypothetical protein